MNHAARTSLAVAVTAVVALSACSGPDGGSDGSPDAGDVVESHDAIQPLLVSSIQPPTGPVEGGTEVAISGRGFTDGVTVTFGANEATDVTVASDVRITATTPAADQSGKVGVTVSLPGGGNDTLSDGFEYTGEVQKLEVGWCTLQHPPSAESTVGMPTDAIFGRVFVEECTNGESKCDEVVAELGYGPADGDPSADTDDYRWISADYNPDHTADDNDEYGAELEPGDPGSYGYLYRFSVDDGDNWTYCDLDGSDNGFQPDQMGELTVDEQASDDRPIDWCNLQHPPDTDVEPGGETEKIYGRVRSGDCTPGSGRCEGITAQLGRGPDGADPTSAPGDFNWTDASHNPDFEGDNDEYQATLSPPNEGQFDYVYRFSGDGGDSWSYCDRDGSDNGFQPDQAGDLTVQPSESVDIGWCNLQHPPEMSVAAGQQTPTVYGRVYVDGCTHTMTNGMNDPTVECGAVDGQVGWGPDGADPTSNPGQFTWKDASYNPGHTADDNDEHQATFTAPQMPGTYRYFYRFTGDGGATWTYCDTDGHTPNGPDGFSADQAGTLTVEP